ncbi:MAG: hypothetical protein NT001_07110 [Candidatus Woesearchaeota archaeon]|nr:hypothetical protein [Candidatus Woesearchaeota archaeon]
MQKKAQASGAGAAILVAIITALIVIYILFLPPAEREALLEGNHTSSDGSSVISGNVTLFTENPGRLDYLAQKSIEHTLPSMNLYTKTKAIELESMQSVYVKNAWFDKTTFNITFPIEDFENTDNIQLVFNVKKASGMLMLKLNGYDIYDNELTSANIEPITLQKSLLKEQNTIDVSVSGVGWKFWRTNEYLLENIKMTGSYTDKSNQEAKVVFQVSEAEKDNLDRVYLKFFPECDINKVDKLEVSLNNNQIFSSVPDCGVLRSLEISPHYLLSEENTLIFRTAEGQYLIDNLAVKSDLKEQIYPTYYFELNKTVLDDITDGNINAKLYLLFLDDTEKKQAELTINTHKVGIDTSDREYSLSLNSYVREGNNVIQIKPEQTLDVVEIKLVLEEK